MNLNQIEFDEDIKDIATSIKKEFGIKKAIKTVFTQFFIAYIASFLIYHLVG